MNVANKLQLQTGHGRRGDNREEEKRVKMWLKLRIEQWVKGSLGYCNFDLLFVAYFLSPPLAALFVAVV